MDIGQEGTTLTPTNSAVTARELPPARNARELPNPCQAVSTILSRVGDKWTVLIVITLADGPKRFNEMKRLIGGISQRMLTLTLRGLERDGLVTRRMFPVIPPKVEYELTDLGHSLRGPIEALGAWAYRHVPAVENARAAFDQRAARRLD